MKRLEAVVAAVAAFLMLTAGLTWKFGPYGLVGPAVALFIALFFVDVKE